MSWNAQRISDVARKSASVDYGAFEAIGLSEIEHACVLDMGCFDGYNTVLKFAPYGNIERVVGIDPCADKIQEARSRTGDRRFAWQVSDAEDFDADDESFDVVYFSHSFQHVRNKEQTIRNTFRLLKPGGFVIIKTIDDSLMISSPDPDEIVRTATRYYAENVRPFCAHTAHTDRFNGQKCPALLQEGGFSSICLKVLYTDTLGMVPQARAALFERLTYFRSKVAPEAGPEVAARMHGLLDAWQALFSRESYYFATPSVVALAQKPVVAGKAEAYAYCGPWFDVPQGRDAGGDAASSGPWRFSPLRESSLGEVMEIENQAFPSPWTPLAYALELRYNRDAHYVEARNDAGVLCGYLGVWVQSGVACITRVAVCGGERRKGLGAALISHALELAQQDDCAQMRLTVREGNKGARAFYSRLGFQECAKNARYYSDPDEDGVVMVRSLRTMKEK